MSPGSSSPEPPGSAEPVVVFVTGRTLRGTLGEAFRAEAVALFERMPGVGTPPQAGSELHTGIGRTVELTAVAVTRAGPVRVDVSVADPAFLAPGERDAGGQRFEIALDDLDGIVPLAGPPGTDLARTAVLTVRSAHPLAVETRVVPLALHP